MGVKVLVTCFDHLLEETRPAGRPAYRAHHCGSWRETFE